MDLALGLLDIGHMMQDAMAEYQVKGVIREGQVENAALPKLLMGQFPQHQAGPDSLNRLGSQVDPRPDRPPAVPMLRIRPESASSALS